MTIKYLTAEVKSATADDPGGFEAIASAPTVDRDNETIAPGAFNPLPRVVPIHTDHRMSADGLVGSARPFYDGDTLRIAGTFAGTPRAQVVRQLVKEGHLGSVSVGFIDAKRDPENRRRIIRGELIEVSLVTVPANRQALVTAAKGGYRSAAVEEARRTAAAAMLAMAEVDARDALASDNRRLRSKGRAALSEAEELLRRPLAPAEALAEAQALLRELGR